MKGYKAFNSDLTCRGFQYEIGKEYKLKGKPIICKKGFHFCESIDACYSYYLGDGKTRICEVEALGKVVQSGDKFATDKIRIIREIPMREAHLNTDDGTSTGYRNTGCYNSGYRNTGRQNTGDYNSGSHNAGRHNSGGYNSGDYNTGDYNTGDWNSGDWNSGNHSCGLFCTDIHPKIKMFDKESDWTMSDWYESGAFEIMESCPSVRTGVVGEKTTWLEPDMDDRQAWWDSLTEGEKDAIKALPNFDADKFCKCVGIYHI